MPKPTNAELQAEVKRLSAPIKDFADPRLKPLLDAANSEAEAQGYCDTYNKILKAIGAPGVAKDWNVNVSFSFNGTEEELKAILGAPAQYSGWAADRKVKVPEVEGTLAKALLALSGGITDVDTTDYYEA